MRYCSCPFVSDASRTLGALQDLFAADRTPATAHAGAAQTGEVETQCRCPAMEECVEGGGRDYC